MGRNPKGSGYRNHTSILLDSLFNRLERCAGRSDDVVGFAYSLSTTAPQKLGDRTAEFERELRDALLKLSPDGRFTEIAELSALIAHRP
jgi:hypothetical protein